MSARAWEISPSEFWQMTIAEMVVEVEMRDTGGGGKHYAGGMTEGDLEEISAASAELRKKRELARRGTETA